MLSKVQWGEPNLVRGAIGWLAATAEVANRRLQGSYGGGTARVDETGTGEKKPTQAASACYRPRRSPLD